MINCSTIQDNISAYLDEELAFDEREQFEKHIANCKPCSHELKAIENTMVALRSLDIVEPPANFHEELKGQLYKIQNNRAEKPTSKWTSRSWFSLGAVAAGLVLMVASWGVFINGELPKNISLSKNQPLEQAAPKMAGMPEEKNIAIFDASGDSTGSAEVSAIEGFSVRGVAGFPPSSENYTKESIDGPPSAPENSLYSYGNFEETKREIVSSYNKEIDLSQGEYKDAGEVADVKVAASQDSEVLAMGAFPSGLAVENEVENEISVATTGINENNSYEFPMTLEIEDEELKGIINKIKAIVEEQGFKIQLTSTETKTKIDILVPVLKQKELGEALKSLVQKEKGILKQIKEEHTNTSISVLIIELSEN